MTVWGIERLFAQFEKMDSGPEGGLKDTIAWILDSSDVAARKPDAVARIKAELAAIDADVPAERRAFCSTGVNFTGRKPV